MQITEECTDSVVVVNLSGRLEQCTAAQIEQDLLALIGEKPVRLVLDCSELTYVSSIGLRVIVMVSKRSRACKGRLALCAMSEPIQRVFNMVGLGDWSGIYPTRAAAVAALA